MDKSASHYPHQIPELDPDVPILMLLGRDIIRIHKSFLPRSLIMANPDNRALQHLATELARLDRQIVALLKKQNELLQRKSQLEASRGVSSSPASSSAASEVRPSVLHHPDFSTRQDTPSSPRPHKEFGNASTAEGLPDRLLHPSHPLPTTDSPHSARRLLQHQFLSLRRPLQHLGPPHRTLFMSLPGVSPLSNRNAFGTVVIHVGTIDICAQQSKVQKEHYQTLLDTRQEINERQDRHLWTSPHLQEVLRAVQQALWAAVLASRLMCGQRPRFRGQLVIVLGASGSLPEGRASS
ncbi:hypothetical protein NFI96_032818 [Prochilodus magdalenae]|nr:hypothetical protein NFI96_032818 [Prochilodus magdalenae]